jgi:antitoxin HigA-1
MKEHKMMHNPPHPGEVLKGLYLEPLGLTVTRAAAALKVSRQALSELINGKTGVSSQMALKLGKAFNTTPDLWLNMQYKYDLWQTKQKINLDDIEVMYG